ncbi:hypothetical protein BH11BAC2_BH11BAC2_13790 [soil metagenome]
MQKNKEIDSLFNCFDILDCLGNPEQLKGYSISLWKTKDIVHMLYVANELYLHEDIDKVFIVGQGAGNNRIYHLIISEIPNKKEAVFQIDYFEKKGFIKVALFRPI